MRKSYLDTFRKYQLNESAEFEDNTNLVDDDTEDPMVGDEEDLDEMSTSAGAGPYDTPNAFGKASDDTVEILGYKKVKDKHRNESTFKKFSAEMFLGEASYHAYKKDPTATPKQKVNQSITEIHRKLREIEKVVNHNVRLKQESGVNNSQYWKSSRENLTKISERLLRVSKQLKELAA
jgi:hypothetical protein